MKKIKEMYLNSMKELKAPKNIALLGMLAALAVVLGFVASIEVGPYIRIGFSSLPNRFVDILFGPFIGAIFGGILDILKFIVKPTGTFFFGFTFNAMLASVIYGTILYKKPISIKWILLADFLIKLIVNCGFNTLWLSMLYGDAFSVLLPARALKNLIMWPIDSVITFVVLTYANKVFQIIGRKAE